jgi:hypothetical protein
MTPNHVKDQDERRPPLLRERLRAAVAIRRRGKGRRPRSRPGEDAPEDAGDWAGPPPPARFAAVFSKNRTATGFLLAPKRLHEILIIILASGWVEKPSKPPIGQTLSPMSRLGQVLACLRFAYAVNRRPVLQFYGAIGHTRRRKTCIGSRADRPPELLFIAPTLV